MRTTPASITWKIAAPGGCSDLQNPHSWGDTAFIVPWSVMIQPPSGQDAPALLASIAPERLRRFRQAVPGGRHSEVIRLYVLDCQLAEQYQALFRAVEVQLRETIHRALSAHFGQRWFNNQTLRLILDQLTVDAIDRAIAGHGGGRDHAWHLGQIPRQGAWQ